MDSETYILSKSYNGLVDYREYRNLKDVLFDGIMFESCGYNIVIKTSNNKTIYPSGLIIVSLYSSGRLTNTNRSRKLSDLIYILYNVFPSATVIDVSYVSSLIIVNIKHDIPKFKQDTMWIKLGF